MLKPFLRNVSGKPSKSDITMFTGGLNTCEDKTLIRDNQMPYMWNITLNKGMSMTTRSNRMTFAHFLEDTTNWGTGEVKKMFATSDKTLLTIEKNGANTEVYELKKTSDFLTKDYIGRVEDSDFYSITECRDSTTKYFMISTMTKLYKVSKDAIEEILEDVTSTPAIAGVLAAHKNRLFVGHGIDLYISKLREYDDFTVLTDAERETATATEIEESGHQIRITNANGDIKALVSYDDKLIVLCERSMHVLYGDSPYSEVNQFTMVDFNNGLGCVSDETWTICNKQLFWLDTDMSVYRYNGAGINKISEPYGTDDYASYGGIKGIHYNLHKMKQFIMSSYDDCVYVGIRRENDRESQTYNLTLPSGMFLGGIDDTSNYIYGEEDNWIYHKAIEKRVLGEGYPQFVIIWQEADNYKAYWATFFTSKTAVGNEVIAMSDRFEWRQKPASTSATFQEGKMWTDDNKIYFQKDYPLNSTSFTGWVINNNITVYYKLAEERNIPITDTTLIAQLNELASNLKTYNQEMTISTSSEGIAPNIQFSYESSEGTKTTPNSSTFVLRDAMNDFNKGSIIIGKNTAFVQDDTPSPTNQVEVQVVEGECSISAAIVEDYNDTLLVYNTKNRVWWAEDGCFTHMCKWDMDTDTPFYYVTDYLVGSKYNNDILILNAQQNVDEDDLFNMVTRHIDSVPIKYAYETKTWTLGTIKKEKTLSNLWFQANAEGKVAVCDYWNEHNVWDEEVTKLYDNYLILGNLRKVGVRHDVRHPLLNRHQGTERQRFIIPRMYLQKINAFSIRVEGEGFGEFYMLEKEWRIK